jgi:5-methylcytosine-specific restriction endonuclease McrA
MKCKFCQARSEVNAAQSRYNREMRSAGRKPERSDLTAGAWLEIQEKQSFVCAYCNQIAAKLTMDHVIPLSRGGTNTRANVVGACKRCNSQKKNRTLQEWKGGANEQKCTLATSSTSRFGP